MELIKIESGVEYIEIEYPNHVTSIRYSQTKELRYEIEDHTVVIVLRNGNTVELNYYEVEDHYNVGMPYASGSSLYKFVASLYGILSTEGLELVITINGDGEMSPGEGTSLIREGDEALLTAKSDATNTFDRFEITDDEGTVTVTTNPYKLLIDKAKSVVAYFIGLLQNFNITITKVGEGTVTPFEGTQSIVEGTSLTVNATESNSDYYLENLKDGDTIVSNPYTWVVSGIKSITATFLAWLTIQDVFSTAPVNNEFVDITGISGNLVLKNGYSCLFSGAEYLRSKNTIVLGNAFNIKIKGAFKSISPAYSQIIGMASSGSTGFISLQKNNTTNYLSFSIRPVGQSVTTTVLNTIPLFNDAYSEFEIDYDNGAIKIYYNGVKKYDYSITHGSGFSTAYKITFGASYANATPMVAEINQFSISNQCDLLFQSGQGNVVYDSLNINDFDVIQTTSVWKQITTSKPYPYTLGCTIYQNNSDSSYMPLIGNRSDVIGGYTRINYFPVNSGFLPLIQTVTIPNNADLNGIIPEGDYTYAQLIALSDPHIFKTMNGIAISRMVVKKKMSETNMTTFNNLTVYNNLTTYSNA